MRSLYNNIHIGSIGIDYRGTPNQLAGCIADANTWQKWAHPFAARTLDRIEGEATFQGITDMVLDLFSGMSAGDLAIITRSGHGTRVPDKSGDESSGFDSAFVPFDYQRNLYLDDQWRVLMQQRKSGTFVLLIDDFCHSGTAARAFMSEAIGRPRYVSFSDLVSQPCGLCAKEADHLCRRRRAFSVRGGLESIDEGIIQFTGCTDAEFSYDANFGGQPNGAATYFLQQAYRQLDEGATVADWHRALTPYFLPTRSYPQTPQLNASDAMRAFTVPGLKLKTETPAQPPLPAPSGADGTLTLGGKVFDVRERK